MAKIQRVFDIEEYATKARTALEKLKQTQQPGDKGGKGGKADVLQAVKSEIKALIDEGYTAKQIANAFKDDVFGILPKTITEMIKTIKIEPPAQTHPRPRRPSSKKNDSPLVEDKKTNEPDNESDTFEVQPDTENL